MSDPAAVALLAIGSVMAVGSVAWMTSWFLTHRASRRKCCLVIIETGLFSSRTTCSLEGETHNCVTRRRRSDQFEAKPESEVGRVWVGDELVAGAFVGVTVPDCLPEDF